MLRQRPVSKCKTTFFLDDVHNPTCIQYPKPQGVGQHSNGLIYRKVYVWPVKLDPVKVVMFPPAQCAVRSFENGAARSQMNLVVINRESCWVASNACRTDRWIAECKTRLGLDELVDPVNAWFCKHVHEFQPHLRTGGGAFRD
jgi:hypothetical protein